MRVRKNSKLLVEPPSSATGDIAFNLIVFFLVCASVQPDSGRKQTLPASEEVEEQQQENQNVEVQIKRTSVAVNGEFVAQDRFDEAVRRRLEGKAAPEDRVVIVKSDDDVAYTHWIDVTSRIEDAGGIITLQLEEEREVVLPD